jgi:hypothetical protein
LCYRLGEGPLEYLVDVLAVAGRTGKVLEASFLGVGDCLALLHLLRTSIVFVAHQHHHRLLQVDTIALHCSFPLAQTVETFSVLEVKDEKDHLGSLEEGITDVLVVWAATEIEEVDSHFSSRNIDLFDSVVDPDGRDILLHKTALAVTFDDAGFAGASVAHRDQLCERDAYFQQNLVALHGSKVQLENINATAVPLLTKNVQKKTK